MSKTRPVKGVGWDVSAIGNGSQINILDNTACFNVSSLLIIKLGKEILNIYYEEFNLYISQPSGVGLDSDVLKLVGIPKWTAMTSLGGKHVEFVCEDTCKVSSIASLI